MKSKYILMVMACAFFIAACNGKKSQKRQNDQEPPSADEIIKHMDENEDGVLSKEEVQGPLKEMFAEIDSNKDGSLSLEEIEKAPKPEGGRPQR
tara:strand:- start:235 stop:516 length:282 start_codon:yes stop_codon:yes gene_type:complete